MKNLLEREDYQEIFPNAKLSADSKASGRWDTARGGMYYAVGVGSNLAGRGGDLIIIDDPHSEQTAMSASGFDNDWDWYTGGPRQRLQTRRGHHLGYDEVVTEGFDRPTYTPDGQRRARRPVGSRRTTRNHGR